MSSKIQLSAAVIALNEAHQLPDLLKSLAWVDEIVVVDGGSRDATAEIARAAGARCVVRPFDNYAAQRNFAADLARGHWVLAIDADERPAPGFAEEVQRRMAQLQASAWRVPVRSRIFGRTFRFSGTQDDRPVRLYDRRRARWTGDVHERLAVQGRVGMLGAHLEHQTIPDLAAFLTKMHRYSSLAAEAAVAERLPPRHGSRWAAATTEFARRLIFKQGWLDGPEGWAFCALSGLSAWITAHKHRRLWDAAVQAAANNN
jgi:glycosyltransferase involved in cell wall biosynthesis